MKKVQRTVILTGGGPTALVGQRVAHLLAGEDEPAGAVAILPAEETGLAAALKQISQLSGRDRLAGQGWTLDRLGEVAAYLVVDVGEPFPVEAAIARLAQAAYEQLRVEVSALVVALVSDLDQQARLIDLAGQGRGLVALSLVNEDGLCLEDSDALITVCARLLYTMITTPLRDAPEWLAELGDGNTTSSMGLAVWEWSPARVQERLARRWVENALARWRQPLPEEEMAPVDGQTHNWLETLEPGYLARHCAAQLAPLPAFSTGIYPHPWQMHDYSDGPGSSEEVSIEDVQEEIFLLLQKARPAALQSIGEEMLDAFPVAGVARLLLFIERLERGMRELGDRLAERQETQEARLEALAGRRQTLLGELETLLAGWPRPSPGAWLRVAANPWRWPGLSWRYWQMRELVQALAQTTAEMQQWKRQQQIAAATAALYHNLEEEIRRFTGQVEEVGDVLAAMEREAAGMPGEEDVSEEDAISISEASVTEALYWQLIESPAIEAQQAASAVGGLGRQLARPDDVVLESLVDAGRERMAEVQKLTAADLLQLLYPTPDALAGWQQTQWEPAAPLWHDDEALVPASGQAKLTLVCGAGVLALESLIGAGENQSRWIETEDRRRITFLRARSIYPDDSRNDEVRHVPG